MTMYSRSMMILAATGLFSLWGCDRGPVVPVSKWDPPGLIQQWGEAAPRQLRPEGLEVQGDRLIVLDGQNVRILTKDGGHQSYWREDSNWPSGMALGEDGNLYLTTGDRLIKIFSPDGTLLREWPVLPTNDIVADYLGGIDLDSEGNILVVDKQFKKVHKFSPEGEFIRSWGEPQGVFGGFNLPSSLTCLSDGFMLVVDSPNILEFSPEGDFLGPWSEPLLGTRKLVQFPDGTLVAGRNRQVYYYERSGSKISEWGLDEDGYHYIGDPRSLAVDGQGNIFVGDPKYNVIHHFDRAGNLLDQWRADWNAGQMRFPNAVVVQRDLVYTLEPGDGRIQKFTTNGLFVSSWGQEGERLGQLYSPRDLAVDPEQHVYVIDGGNNRVVKFDGTGRFLKQWPEWDARQVAVGPLGTVHVSTKDDIRRYSPDGTYLSLWRPRETADLQGLDVDDSGRVYVVEAGTGSVITLSPEGREISSWYCQYAPNPQTFLDLAVDKRGFVVLSSSRDSRIDMYSLNGVHFGTWRGSFFLTSGSKAPFIGPRGVETDADGHLWVVDERDGRVMHFEAVF